MRSLPRRHCGRVVKAMDLKSIGFSRAGSNPANVVFSYKTFYYFLQSMQAYLFIIYTE